MDNKCLCFNWEPGEKYNKWKNIEIHGETLRDGLQSPSAEHPDIGSKIEILQSMSDMGIESVSIGFPASSHRIYNDCSEMLSYLSRIKDIQAACIARTLESDIQPIINLSQKYGMQLEADIFIGISSIRQ